MADRMNGKTAKRVARGGAAAFAVGLFLAGPQAVAAADSQQEAAGPAGAGDSASTATKAPVARGVARPKAALRGGRTARGLSPMRAGPRAASATPGPAGTATNPADSRRGLPRALASALKPHLLPAAQSRKAAAEAGAGEGAPTGATPNPSVGAVPAMGRPAAPPALATAVSSVRDRADIAQTTVFNTLANFLINLPQNDFTTYLEGAFAQLRARAFNKEPQVYPSTPYVAADGKIRGRIGAVDLESDRLTFRVVEGPEFGTVEVGTDGSYAYSPGPLYAGSDFFSVEVAQAERKTDLGTPLNNNRSSVVVIDVGASAPAAPLRATGGETVMDLPDVTVYLPDAAGHVTVRKSPLLNRFTATVTLTEATAGTRLNWVESTGDLGEISLGEAEQLWPKFQAKAKESGGGVDLGVAYTAGDGTESALLLSDVSMSTNSLGQYVFTGRLSRDSSEDADSIDSWDVTGHQYKLEYENFRTAHGIGRGSTEKFTPVDFDFSHAAVFADTTSPISYVQTGLYTFDHQQPATPDGAVVASAPSTAASSALAGYWSVPDVTDALGLSPSAYKAVPSSTSPGGEEVDKAFDGSVSTKYLNFSGAGSGVTVDLGDPGSSGHWVVTGLGLTTANDYQDRDPISYRVEGSADGSTFTKVAEGTLVPPTARLTGYPDVSFTNAKDYRYYRVLFPAVRSGNQMQISEIRLPGYALPETAKSDVTASIPLGQSFVIGRKDGSLELWTDGRKELLQKPGGFGVDESAGGGPIGVTEILAYDRPLQDVEGNQIASSFTGSIEGDTLTVTSLGAGSRIVVGQQITGTGVIPGTTVTKLIVPAGARCATEDAAGNCTQATVTKGADAGLGSYQVSIAQTVASTVITQPSVGAVAPGFVVGLSSGAVHQWSATAGWTELHDASWNSAITAMTAYKEGIVVGLKDGSVQKWDGPDADPDPATWKDNWTDLLGAQQSNGAVGQAEGVVGIIAHRGATAQDDGIVVALGNPARDLGTVAQVQFWDPVRGWTELSAAANEWATGDPYVTAMTAYRAGGKSLAERYGVDGVAVGYSDGSVRYWDGTVGYHAGWEELRGKGSAQRVSTVVPYTSPEGLPMLAVGLSDGGVQLYTGYPASTTFGGGWTRLHDAGWGSGVRSMVTYSSSTVGSGLIVGLNNGSMQLWSGDFPNFGETGNAAWTELHDAGWGAGAATVIPFRQNLPDKSGNVVARDGVVVGLGNGSVQQWSGLISGKTGQADWIQIVCGPNGCTAPAPSPAPLSVDGTLEDAVTFAKAVVKAGNPDWGEIGGVGSSGDPLFDNRFMLPPCAKDDSCDGQYVPIASYIEKTPLTKSLAAPGTELSVDLKYDVNAVIYGYAFMPNGTWAKLSPGNWSFAALAAVETGPSLTVNIGDDGKALDIPRTNLFNYQFTTRGPLGFDTVALGLGVDGALGAQLLCGDDGSAKCPSELNAHAYLVPGILLTYNTQSKPGGLSLGFNWYPDLDYEEFKQVSGASVAMTLTPYATIDYGIFAPDSWWFIGGWSLLKVGLGYENPLSAKVTVQKTDGVSLTLGSQGILTAHAGLLEAVTGKLSRDWTIPVYDVNTTYKL